MTEKKDAAAATSTAPKAEPTANDESFLPQSTVLIVDDNPQNVELLAGIPRIASGEAGHRRRWAGSAAAKSKSIRPI